MLTFFFPFSLVIFGTKVVGFVKFQFLFAEGDSGVPISELNQEYLVLRCGLVLLFLVFVFIFNTDVYRSLCQSLLVTELDERYIGVPPSHLVCEKKQEKISISSKQKASLHKSKFTSLKCWRKYIGTDTNSTPRGCVMVAVMVANFGATALGVTHSFILMPPFSYISSFNYHFFSCLSFPLTLLFLLQKEMHQKSWNSLF